MSDKIVKFDSGSASSKLETIITDVKLKDGRVCRLEHGVGSMKIVKFTLMSQQKKESNSEMAKRYRRDAVELFLRKWLRDYDLVYVVIPEAELSGKIVFECTFVKKGCYKYVSGGPVDYKQLLLGE